MRHRHRPHPLPHLLHTVRADCIEDSTEFVTNEVANREGRTNTRLGLHGVLGKHAIVGLCKSLRVEAARNRVKVSALYSGVVQTPLRL